MAGGNRKTGIIGGTSFDLDGVNGASLNDGDYCAVFLDGTEQLYFYRLDATIGGDESYPDIIKPDMNPGSKRWLIQGIFVSTDVFRLGDIVSIQNYDSLSAAITAIDSDNILLVINEPTTLTESTVIPENISVWVTPNGYFIGGSYDLTIQGEFHCDTFQRAFDSTSEILFDKNSVTEVFPQWFNAQGDSTSDDLVAFQQCLASMSTNNVKKMTIPHVGKGGYLLSDQWEITRGNIWIDIYDNISTDTTAAICLIKIHGEAYSPNHIENIKLTGNNQTIIDGNGQNVEDGYVYDPLVGDYDTVRFDYADKIFCQGIHFINGLKNSFSATHGHQVNVNDCRFSTAQYENGCTIAYNYIGEYFDEGDSLDYLINSNVTSCFSDNNSDAGFTAITGDFITFENCISDTDGVSFSSEQITTSHNNVARFINCKAIRPRSRGWFITHDGCTLENCYIYGDGSEQEDSEYTTRSGIYAYSTANLKIINTEISNFAHYGIRTRGFKSPSVFTDIIIDNCYIHDCGTGGIGLKGIENAIIKNAKIHDTYRAINISNAVVNFNTGGGRTDIQGCNIYDNGYYGVLCDNIENAIIKNNNITDCPNTALGHGSILVNDVGNSYIESNIIMDSTSTDINWGIECSGIGNVYERNNQITNNVNNGALYQDVTIELQTMDLSFTRKNALNWQNRMTNIYNGPVTGYGVGVKFKLDAASVANKWAGIAGIAESNFANAVGLNFFTADTGVPTSKMSIGGDGTVNIPQWRLGDIELASSYTSFDAAITAIGANEKTLVVDETMVVAVGGGVVVPSNIHLVITQDGMLTLTGFSLTINGSFTAPLKKVFNLTGGGVVVFGNSSVDCVYAEFWGAISDYNPTNGTGTDCTEGINNALSAHKNVKLLIGNYLVSESIIIPVNCKLSGIAGSSAGSIIYPATSGASWTNNYVIMYNSTDGSGWTSSYPAPDASISNIRISGYSDGAFCDAVPLFIAGGFTVDNLSINKCLGGVYTSSDYCDQITLRKLHILYSNGGATDYDVSVKQLGDAFRMEQCHISGGSNNGVKITGVWGGNLSDCIINAPLTIEKCESLTINNLHAEDDFIANFNISNITMQDCYVQKNLTDATFTITGATNSENFVAMENIHISALNTRNFSSELADIDYYKCSLSLKNVFRRMAVSGVIEHSREFGILVAHNGVMFDDFNNFSPHNSLSCDLKSQTNGYIEDFRMSKRIVQTGGNWYPISSLGTSSIETWREATDTYYYRPQLLIDPLRMIGKTANHEDSVALTNGGSGSLMTFSGSPTYAMRNTMVRMYRGTSANNYDKYVDLPMIYCIYIYDDGIAINGFIWKDRIEGPADNVNVSNVQEINNLKAIVSRSATPSYGSWTKTDEIINSNPSSGAEMGWICSESGTFEDIDSTCTTDGASGIIYLDSTAALNEFQIGMYATIDDGFPTTGPYRIIDKDIDAGTITLDEDSDSAVDTYIYTEDPTFVSMPDLQTAYGEFYWYDNITATTIETAGIPILIKSATSGLLSGITFGAGSSGAITSYAFYGAGLVRVTSANHLLSTGDIVSIHGTTNYNNVFETTKIDNNNYSIISAFNGDDGASDWDESSYLQYNGTTSQVFTVAYTISFSEAGGAGGIFHFRTYQNSTGCQKCVSKRKMPNNDVGSVAGHALVELNTGDRMMLSVESDGTNPVLIEHGNFSLHQM